VKHTQLQGAWGHINRGEAKLAGGVSVCEYLPVVLRVQSGLSHAPGEDIHTLLTLAPTNQLTHPDSTQPSTDSRNTAADEITGSDQIMISSAQQQSHQQHERYSRATSGALLQDASPTWCLNSGGLHKLPLRRQLHLHDENHSLHLPDACSTVEPVGSGATLMKSMPLLQEWQDRIHGDLTERQPCLPPGADDAILLLVATGKQQQLGMNQKQRQSCMSQLGSQQKNHNQLPIHPSGPLTSFKQTHFWAPVDPVAATVWLSSFNLM